MVVAIIPARGGSKRLPKKNIVPFCGKPMITWTIEAALECGLFDDVVVSTDSEEIAEVSRAAGASVPFLREEAADDISPVSAATIWTLRRLEQHGGRRFNHVAQLMANCPLRRAQDIAAAWANFQERGAGFQISAFSYGFMNPWWARKVDGEGRPTPLFPEMQMQRSQDLPRLLCPTGAIWLAERDALVAAGTFYGEDHRLHELSWQAGLDIDDEHDLALGEAVAAAYFREGA